MPKVKPSLWVMLVNLRSAYNVGSIFRTAESAGVDKLLLTGYTPTPLEPKLDKTALGATMTQTWEHHCHPEKTLTYCQNCQYSVIACEPVKSARNLFHYQFPLHTCLVFGNEITGLDPAFLKKSSAVIQIPQFGKKESLNVASAAGIIIYSWRRQYS